MEKRMDLLQSFVRYHSHCFNITPLYRDDTVLTLCHRDTAQNF